MGVPRILQGIWIAIQDYVCRSECQLCTVYKCKETGRRASGDPVLLCWRHE